MKKRLIIYLASLFACLIASCSEKEETANGGGEPQSYIPFAISKGVNISNWLSQSDVRGEERKNYFTEAEVQQLAGFGFDHIRLPADEEQLFTEDGQKIPEAFELLHNAIKWCEKANMKVIVDMHILRSHHFNNNESGEPIKSFFDTFENGATSYWYSTQGSSVTGSGLSTTRKRMLLILVTRYSISTSKTPVLTGLRDKRAALNCQSAPERLSSNTCG